MNKGTLSIILALFVLILVVVLIVVVILKYQKGDEVLIEEEAKLPQDTQIVPADPRIDSKKIQSKPLDSNLIDSLEQQTQGATVKLELFDNEVLECKVEGIDKESPDVTNLLCSSDKYTAFFTYDDDVILGTIDDNTKYDTSYVIVTERDSGEILLEEHTRN